MKGFPGPKVYGMEASERLQDFKTSRLQDFKTSRLQDFKTSRLQDFRCLKKIQTRLGLNHAAYFFKAKDFRSKKIQSIFLRQRS
jgi:hypothetical protein